MAKAKSAVSAPIAQWYVVNTFSGTEKQFVHDIKSKIIAYNITGQVQDIRLVTEVVKEEEEIKRENAPKAMRTTKTTSWQVLPNGNYKKIVVKEKNKYAGYVFVKMIMDDATWMLIRNTPGVTGFIGSSGKGTKPFPVTPDEILGVLGFELGQTVTINKEGAQGKQGVLTLSEKTSEPVVELPNGKQIPVTFYEIERVAPPPVAAAAAGQAAVAAAPKVERIKAHFEVGNTVHLKDGLFAGFKGTVTSINLARSTATIEIVMFGGRPTSTEADFANIVTDGE